VSLIKKLGASEVLSNLVARFAYLPLNPNNYDNRRVRTMKKVVGLLLILSLLLLATAAFSATWRNASVLNDSQHTYAKTARVFAATTGGFHAAYKNANNSRVYYRRWNGVFGTTYDANAGSSYGTHDICQAGNGDIWITWENWADPENIYAVRSTNGGSSWTAYQITNYAGGGYAKNPEIQPLGDASSSQVLALNWHAGQKMTYHNKWTGSSWAGNTSGWWCDNSYAICGSCRALSDGAVWRCYGKAIGSVYHIFIRRFDGSSWGPETQVSEASSGFTCRPAIAVNAYGKILVVWENDGSIRSRYYNGYSWGSEQIVDSGIKPSVVAMPNSSGNFYMVYGGTSNLDRCYGRLFSDGYWSSADLVSQGLGSGYVPDTDLACSAGGTLYAVFEYWVGSNCQQYYTYCTDFQKKTKNDFSDGDGRSDLALYLPGSTSYWVTRLSSSNWTQENWYDWGSSNYGDIHLTGDYDNDGKTDLAIFRPGSSAWWYIKLSSTGYSSSANFQRGTSGDIPLTGDWDGDKQTDIAVFRPGSQGYFIVWKSSSGYNSSQSYAWGTTGDFPVTGDWDGDGRTDCTVLRQVGSAYRWYILKSTGGNVYYDWGCPGLGDIIVSGDFDGDRKTDCTVVRPGSSMYWYVLKSSTGFSQYSSYQWGTTGDKPVTCDYDGDRQTDICVYRPGNPSIWYVKTSSSGYGQYFSVSFGGSNYVPAGSASQQPFAH